MKDSLFKKAAYTLLDWLTPGKGVARKINGMKVRFPARWSHYYEVDYESENYNFLKEQVKPGMHIIDVGAHLGLFSSVCSQLAGPEGKIVCFEPTPETFKLLQQTLGLNQCSNVTAVQAAVSDKEGMATFYVSETAGCNSNSLVKNKLGGTSQAYDVRLMTLDGITADYLLKPSLVKIDAEGAELDVLKGGVTTFKKYKPILILGLHPAFIKAKNDSLASIWDVLIDCGYEISLGGILITKEDFCSRELLFDVHCCGRG